MNPTPRIQGDALRKLRLARRLSVAEFAKAAGMHESAIYRLESGLRTGPRMATIRRLADALNVEVEALISDDQKVA